MYNFTQSVITKAVAVVMITAWGVCRCNSVDMYMLLHEGIIMPKED